MKSFIVATICFILLSHGASGLTLKKDTLVQICKTFKSLLEKGIEPETAKTIVERYWTSKLLLNGRGGSNYDEDDEYDDDEYYSGYSALSSLIFSQTIYGDISVGASVIANVLTALETLIDAPNSLLPVTLIAGKREIRSNAESMSCDAVPFPEELPAEVPAGKNDALQDFLQKVQQMTHSKPEASLGGNEAW